MPKRARISDPKTDVAHYADLKTVDPK